MQKKKSIISDTMMGNIEPEDEMKWINQVRLMFSMDENKKEETLECMNNNCNGLREVIDLI
jgi:hypothetical protein